MSDRSTVRCTLPTVLSAFAMLLCSPAHSAPSVPWLNQPAAQFATTAPAGATGTRPCASSDMRIAAGPAGAWHGQATQEIRLANTGADACFLTGFPTVQLLPTAEAPQTVGASEAAPQLANTRVDLAPGEEAVLLLGAPAVCEAANKPQRKAARRLQVALPGGGLKTLDGVYLDTLCGRATVVKFHPVQNEAAAAAASPLAQLGATLSAPDEASRGGTLHYTVTLTNRSGNAVSLANCPAYSQSVYAGGQPAATTLRLNCAAAGAQIPANSSVSFDMQAPVPANLAGANAKLSWKLQDGPAVGKIVTLR